MGDFLTGTDIICSRCGKSATILASAGTLCKECWLEVRLENRKRRQKESLDKCFQFQYGSKPKFTDEELKIVNEIMCELKDKNML